MTTMVIEAHLHPRTSQRAESASWLPTHAPHASAFDPIPVPAGDVDYMVSAQFADALVGLFLNDGTGRFVYARLSGDPTLASSEQAIATAVC